MKTIILIATLTLSTNVWAQDALNSMGKYNAKDQTYEITYDELVNELSAKKVQPKEDLISTNEFTHIQALFGYSFSSMNFDMGSSTGTFNLSGLDLRLNGKFTNSNWQAEAGFKNYGRSASAGKSAQATMLSGMMKMQDSLDGSLNYVVGAGASTNFISTDNSIKKQNESQLSLNVQGGVRSSLSPKFSWGADVGAYSPISGGALKSGMEVSLLLSALL